jgi:hypothetical protein
LRQNYIHYGRKNQVITTSKTPSETIWVDTGGFVLQIWGGTSFCQGHVAGEKDLEDGQGKHRFGAFWERVGRC